jgi:phosphate transport system permease protein
MRTSRWGEVIVVQLIRAAGYSAIVFIGLILFFLIREGGPALAEVPFSSLLSARWYPIEAHFGLLPLLGGTFVVTLGATAIAAPLGVLTAVYVAQVAPRWAREVLKPLIELLAGIPSVALGFIGILVFVPVIRTTFGLPTGLSALTGAILLGLIAIPTIVSVAEDAIDAVPRTYRDAALALGATDWQTIWRVIVPAARTGITMAVMLGVGRAIGETMAVMMVTGNAPVLPSGLQALFHPVRTMTATIAAEMGEVANGSTHYHTLFLIGVVLFLITLAVNLVAASIVFRQGKRAERILS